MPATNVQPLRVVVAPDSFKGTLTATQAAEAIAAGVLEVFPDAEVTQLPMADGGEGTMNALASAWHARPTTVPAVDALGRPITGHYCSSADTALIELADSTGLTHVTDRPLQPLQASTFGTGMVLRAALAAGARRVLVTLGGSASSDGGAGILQALGVRIVDAADAEIPRGGAALALAAAVDLTDLSPAARSAAWQVAVDVTNPLLGPSGAAEVFGPQKGATPAEVAELDATLAHWARLLNLATGREDTDLPGGGAAGGTAFALASVFDADLVPGSRLVADAIGLAAATKSADLVITGEGRFDAQSLSGKVVSAVAQVSAAPVVVVAGAVTVPRRDYRAAGISSAIGVNDPFDDDLPSDPAGALTSTTAQAMRSLAAGRLLPG